MGMDPSDLKAGVDGCSAPNYAMPLSRLAYGYARLATGVADSQFGSSFAQQEKGIIGKNNWLNNWTEFRPNQDKHGEPTQILSGNITQDTKLTKRDTYLLLGNVFVTDNTTLTIEPGTVIIGDFKTNGSLIITKGSKIMAEGEETDPIIFTSNRSVKKEGDWGGVFILGDAPINKFGNGSSLNYGLQPSSFENIKTSLRHNPDLSKRRCCEIIKWSRDEG